METRIGRVYLIGIFVSFFAVLCLLAVSVPASAENGDLDSETLTYDIEEFEKIKKEIKENGLNWTAKLQPKASIEHRSRIKAGPSLEEMAELYAELFPFSEADETVMLPPPPSTENDFSWRTYDGKIWTSPARDQGDCGSCWIFSPVNCIETANNLAHKDPALDVNLSEQNILSCVSMGSCEEGGMAEVALQRAKSVGVPLESCHPYTATNGNCSDQCEDFSEGLVRVTDFGAVGSDWYSAPSEAQIKSALSYGPVTTAMMVYADFYYYESGVYQRTPGSEQQAGHGISIIGWNDEHDSWYIENSWGMGWGQSGFGEIKRGDSDIGGQGTYWVEVGHFNMNSDLDVDSDSDGDSDSDSDDTENSDTGSSEEDDTAGGDDAGDPDAAADSGDDGDSDGCSCRVFGLWSGVGLAGLLADIF